MNCESVPFFKQPLWHNQIFFTTIKIIYNGTSKSVRESGCFTFVNSTFNLKVKIRGNFLSSVQCTNNSILFLSHWDFWCPVYRESLYFVAHLSCDFAVTSNNLCIQELGWIQVTQNYSKQLKLRSIIDQTGTYIYKTSKVLAKYIGPIAKNDYTIRDTLAFPDLLESALSNDNYEDVFYDLESLLTSIPV